MRLRLSNQQVWSGFGASISILLVIGLLFYQGMASMVKSATQRREAYLSMIAIEDFLGHLTDAETGQRGYLLTGREHYLARYTIAQQQIQKDYTQMVEFLRDDPKSFAVLSQIHPLLEDKMDELQGGINIRRQHGLDHAIAHIQTDRGKNAMDKIRELAEKIETDEAKRYQALDEKTHQIFLQVNWFSIIAGSLALCLLIVIQTLLMHEMNQRKAVNEKLLTEIKERQNAERQIQDLNQSLNQKVLALEASNRELEAFSYSVSHDLRAPLRSIDGFSKMLLAKTQDKLNESERHYLDNVCVNSQRMGELIDDLLKLSRLTRSEMQYNAVNLSELAHEILAAYHQQEPERQVQFKVMDSVVVQGDLALLRVLLENLLGNAWKFTSHNPQAAIEFGMRTDGERPVYYVQDNGVGFNMKYVDKLFGAFQRLHRTEEFPGTGIGLATVARIMHRHGGQVWAEGAVNQGATFYFSFP